MELFTRSSAHDVFRNTRKRRCDDARLTLYGAKNAVCSGQIVLREHGEFDITGVEFGAFSAPFIVSEDDVGYYFQDYIKYNDGEYPDPLSDAPSVHVPAESSQSVWITVNVKPEALSGLCTFNVTVKTSAGDFTVPASVRVFGVTVPDADKSEFSLEYFLDPFTSLAGERWGENREKFLSSYCESLSMIRNNSIDVQIIPLLCDAKSKRISETEWALDFSYVGKYVDFMTARVPTKYIAVRSTIASVNGDTLPVIGYDGGVTWEKYGTKDANAWFYAYIRGIYEYFKSRGMEKMLLIRLQDEPHYTECWKWARDICREAAPGVPCGEPLDEHSSGLGLQGYIDQYIPRINVYEEGADYYDRMRKQGSTLWVYSCCFPEEPWFINKFIDHPHVHSRLMSWGCYARGITGFLHWGYNYWSDTSLYGTAPGARFKGDGFIVYPDKENLRVTPSTRLLATAEGIVDYELLKIVEKKDPFAAMAICESLVRRFNEYDDDPDAADAARIRLLSAAEEASL